jgi:hypothetical protein
MAGLLGGPKPTNCFTLKNLTTLDEIRRETDQNAFVKELLEEVRQECLKYGKVDSLFIDKDTALIQIKFLSEKDAANAHDSLRTK